MCGWVGVCVVGGGGGEGFQGVRSPNDLSIVAKGKLSDPYEIPRTTCDQNGQKPKHNSCVRLLFIFKLIKCEKCHFYLRFLQIYLPLTVNRSNWAQQ